jgi:hypothetical protein
MRVNGTGQHEGAEIRAEHVYTEVVRPLPPNERGFQQACAEKTNRRDCAMSDYSR